MTKLSLGRVLAASLLGVTLVVPLAGPATAAPRTPDRIELPNGFLPEGITIGPGKVAYFGSRADGDLYRADLRTGKGEVFSQGPGTQAVGLKSDQRKRLYVAGGESGTGRVVSIGTGKTSRTYTFTTNKSFVNDVVLTRRAAWFTDSLQAQIYQVSRSRKGVPAPAWKFRTVPLSGDWVQTPGVNNANGISTTPDGRALLVVQSNTGNLYRVNQRTGRAKQVDLGGTVLTNGDGLLRRGRILYAVQNQLDQVAVLRLNRSGTSGELVATLKNPDFDVPTTVAASGKSLYLPNARFSTPPTPDTPYWVTRIPRY